MSDNAYLINAITGEKIITDVKFFMSLDELRDFISQKWHIPSEQLLILLPFGNKLKSSGFRECLRSNTLDENEFYVYDRRLFSITNKPTVEGPISESDDLQKQLFSRAEMLLKGLLSEMMQRRESSLLKPINSPLVNANLERGSLNARTVTSLLTTSLGWLSALEIDVHYFRTLIGDCAAQTSEILKCLSICEQYLGLYCFDVEKLYNSNVEFLTQLAQNGQASKWRECYEKVLSKLQGIEGPLERYVDLKMMETVEKSTKLLDQSVNSKLKRIKRDLDTNADLRTSIANSIRLLRDAFAETGSKDNLEETMLERFDEIVEETRRRSRDFLEQDSIDLSNDSLEGVHSYLLKAKNEVSGKLYTIAQALYAQSEQFIEQKNELQKKSVLLLGQIAFVQVETISIKRKLLNDCNKDLDLYQKNEIHFAKIEDIPLIYGLFLIEKYRRECWVLQVLSRTKSLAVEFKQIKDKEDDHRTKWIENFGPTASLFCRDLKNFSDLEKTELMEFNGAFNQDMLESDQIATVQQLLRKTSEIIDNYATQLSQLEVADNVYELVSQSFSEAKTHQLTILRSREQQETSSYNATSQIKGYRARIKKLESLLHDARYSNPGHWPSGILNTTFVTPFHNSVTTVKSRMGSSSMLESDRNLSLAEVVEVENNLRNLQETNEKLRSDEEALNMQLLASKRKITDLGLEVMAFKETMAFLNKELARLTDEEEKARLEKSSRETSFKHQIETVIQENSLLIQEVGRLNRQVEVDDGEKKETNARAEKLDEELDQEKRSSREKATAYEEEIRKLQERLMLSEKENESLKSKQNKSSSEVTNHEKNQAFITDRNPKHEKEDTTDLEVYSGDVETMLYDAFASDVFMLENIGLLLSFDDNERIIIKRVKGLRKGQTQGILDDSIQIPETEMLVQSLVYKDIKKLYEEAHGSNDMEKRKLLVEEIKKVYSSKLYETAVIRRFKDIETLAKKLTKENKKKRGQLESYQNQKVTLKNFQIGDLALFLPTREHNTASESSVSSLNSSFSSIDLSTPPPFDTAPIHPSSAGKEKSSKVNQSRPWAAFTAFDENTRYFLKDDNCFTKGKDWFVGRILTLERYVAEDVNSNPYKLPKGAPWFQVTAVMVSCQG